mgnify:CR=1 FL=1
MTLREDTLFTDFDMSFEQNASTLSIGYKTGYEAVAQSLKNLVLNKKLWHHYNTDIYNLLFEQMDFPFGEFIIIDQLREFLLQREPRVEQLIIEPERGDDKLTLNVTFSLKSYPSKSVKFPIFVRTA